MKSAFLILLLIVPTVGLAEEPLSRQEVRAAAENLYENIQSIAQIRLKMRNGVVTETDQSLLLEAGAALNASRIEFSKMRSLDTKLLIDKHLGVVGFLDPEANNKLPTEFSKYFDCELAAIYLARIADKLADRSENNASLSDIYSLYGEAQSECADSLN
jgi:hypothetical protein